MRYNSQRGDTALISAARNNDICAVKTQLLENKAHINSPNIWDNTALTEAAEKGHDEIVGLLLAQNADAAHLTHNGETSLVRATRNEHIETTKLLLLRKLVKHDERQQESHAYVSIKTIEILEIFTIAQLGFQHFADWRNRIGTALHREYFEELEKIIAPDADTLAIDRVMLLACDFNIKYKIAAMAKSLHNKITSLGFHTNNETMDEFTFELRKHHNLEKFFLLPKNLQHIILLSLKDAVIEPSKIVVGIRDFIERIEINSISNLQEIQRHAIVLALKIAENELYENKQTSTEAYSDFLETLLFSEQLRNLYNKFSNQSPDANQKEHKVSFAKKICPKRFIEIFTTLLNPEQLEEIYLDTSSLALTCKQARNTQLPSDLDNPKMQSTKLMYPDTISIIQSFLAYYIHPKKQALCNISPLHEIKNLLHLYNTHNYKPCDSLAQRESRYNAQKQEGIDLQETESFRENFTTSLNPPPTQNHASRG